MEIDALVNHLKSVLPASQFDELMYITAERRAEVVQAKSRPPIWEPLPGPQQTAYHCGADEIFFGGSAGSGKALTLDTPIPTPNGWSTMGDLKVGSVLFDERGKACSVVAETPIMHDHDIYAVVFDDGSIIHADGGHQWLTFSDRERVKTSRRSDAYREKRRLTRPSVGKGIKPDLAKRNRERLYNLLPPPTGTVRSTYEILATLRIGNRTNHSVPVAMPLQLSEKLLPVPPYVLGAWLGDGHNSGTGFTSADTEVIQEIRKGGFRVRKRADKYGYGILGLKTALRSLSLLYDKHIPMIYLRASHNQRLALLQGLMDTDGGADKCGACEFTSTNRRLIETVHELMVSLGIKCAISTGRAILDGKDYGEKYRINFTSAFPVFRLPRKRARQKTTLRGVQKFRYIKDVIPIQSQPVKCIAVDSDSQLYLAGKGMIPTHNSDLLLGLALTAHKKSIIFRREYPQLKDLILRSQELLFNTHAAFNGHSVMWRNIPGGRSLEFGAVQYDTDVRKYQGRAHDLKAFDEVSAFTEYQYRFLIGWARSISPNQRVRIVATGNPPTTAEGEWVLKRWGAWIDGQHPNPAKPGELRWYTVVDDKEIECESSEAIQWEGETVYPKSRTFIPGRLSDNPYLLETGYEAILQGMPEPLRSQLLYGDFSVGLDDDPWQLIPTDWIREAQGRWTPQPSQPLTALGVDVARGGSDATVIAKRHGNWFALLIKHPGRETPDGGHVAALVIKALENAPALVNIDVIGIGSSPYDTLKANNIRVNPINAGAASAALNLSQQFGFANKRAEMWWKFREALEPGTGEDLALPPDPELLADLSAPRYKIVAKGVQVESKDEIKRRLGRSPDSGDAVVMALQTVKPRRLGSLAQGRSKGWT